LQKCADVVERKGSIMDILSIVLTIAVCILTVTLVVVGVYVVMVLREVKMTLERVNTTIDMAEEKINAIASPVQNFVGMTSSLGAGLKIFESFVGWLNRSKSSERE
jgi:hypothetical protein